MDDPQIREMYQTVFDDIDAVTATVSYHRLLMSVYVLVLMFRFFKSFANQPKLALVTDTLLCGFVDIFHFVIVFLTIFLSYAVGAVILFGQHVRNLSRHTWAILTLFEMLMGDFDFNALAKVNRTTAFIWFFSFMWLVFLILLNMLLAIVMDHYAAVTQRSKDALTLWSQAATMVRRQRETNLGQRIGLDEVLDVVEKETMADVVTSEDLVRHLDKMPITQADRVVTRCEEWLKMNGQVEGVGMFDAMHLIGHIDRGLGRLQVQMNQVLQDHGQASHNGH